MGWLRKRYGTHVSHDWDPLTVYRSKGGDGRWRWAVYNGGNLPIEYGETSGTNACRREAIGAAHRILREMVRRHADGL